MHSKTEFSSGALYDIGSGESPYKEFFLIHADSYIAVDWADSFYVTNTDIEADQNKRLPIDLEVAESVVSLSALENLCEPQVMLNEAFCTLIEGGSLIRRAPRQWSIYKGSHDYLCYAPYGLEYVCKRPGFVDTEIEPQPGYFTMIVLKWNYVTRCSMAGPRPAFILLTSLLSIFWHLDQLLAPWFDNLVRNWGLEAPGYFVTTRKP